ncbi:hypothetical protein [Vibrio fortis]|uniref:hypothetical protein n=1 Tax=Vibrio fortis TaxID=212667 RepID=UPI000A8ADCFB
MRKDSKHDIATTIDTKWRFAEKASSSLVVCETIAVVREVTSREFFNPVDMETVSEASNALRRRAALLASRTTNVSR